MHKIVHSPLEQVVTTLFNPKPKTLLLTGVHAVYRLSLRSAASLARRRRVIYLDGANLFDPYELARYAHQRGLCEETLLKSVFVRRAFTCYQMYEMVARLPIDRLADSHAVLIIAGPCVTFFDESIPHRCAARLFYHMMHRFTLLSRAYLPMIIVQPYECSLAARYSFINDLRGLGHSELVIGDGYAPTLFRNPKLEASPTSLSDAYPAYISTSRAWNGRRG